MQRYESLSPLPARSQFRRNDNRSNAEQRAEIPHDPLQVLGSRNSSVALELSASFGGLQIFLQRIEALELLAESSELQLRAVAEENNADWAQFLVTPMQLTLKLSFYDLAPISDVTPNGFMSSPPCGW